MPFLQTSSIIFGNPNSFYDASIILKKKKKDEENKELIENRLVVARGRGQWVDKIGQGGQKYKLPVIK